MASIRTKGVGPALGEVKSPFAESLLDKKAEEERKGVLGITKEAFSQLKIRTLGAEALTSKEEMKDIETDIAMKKGGRNAHLVGAIETLAVGGGGAAVAASTGNPGATAIAAGITVLAAGVQFGLSIWQHRNASTEENEYNKRARHTAWKSTPDSA